jgi:hypothetical protein
MLAILASACAWVAGPRLRTLPGIGSAEAAPLAPALAALFSDRRSAEAIGAAYLRSLDRTEVSTERLMRELAVDDASTMTPARLKRAIGARIRRDFAEGAVVTIDGWMLSQTEARLCGLVSRS